MAGYFLEDKKPLGKFIYTSPITGYKTEGEYIDINNEHTVKEGDFFKKIPSGIYSDSGIYYYLDEIQLFPYE